MCYVQWEICVYSEVVLTYFSIVCPTPMFQLNILTIILLKWIFEKHPINTKEGRKKKRNVE